MEDHIQLYNQALAIVGDDNKKLKTLATALEGLLALLLKMEEGQAKNAIREMIANGLAVAEPIKAKLKVQKNVIYSNSSVIINHPHVD